MNRTTAFHSCVISLCLVTMNAAPSRAQSAAQTGTTNTMAAHPAAPPSTSLTLTIDDKPTTLSVAELQAMPQKTVTVHNEHTKKDEAYTGVPLGELLAKCGFPLDKTTHQKMLRSYVIAEGTDQYWVLYSLTEIEAYEHNGDVIVAISMDGNPLGQDGQLKLVATSDKKPERWVRNLSGITVKTVK
jgi:hypothetical protein